LFEISVECAFDAVHSVRLPDGSREDPHSHTWRVRVAVRRERLGRSRWVMDFRDLHRLLTQVLEPLRGADLGEHLPDNPTAEALAEYVARGLEGLLPESVSLGCVEVEEAPGCVCRYWPSGRA